MWDDVFALVEEFLDTFSQPHHQIPTVPDPQTINLRLALVAEEVDEFVESAAVSDRIGVADALADIAYVVAGTALAWGVRPGPAQESSPDFRFELSLLVEASASCDPQMVAVSIARFLDALEVAAAVWDVPLASCVAEVHRSNMTKLHPTRGVVRTESGKIMKGDWYSPPELAPILT